jgi:hypothetical protein
MGRPNGRWRSICGLTGPKSITLPDSERFRRDSHPVASDIVPNHINPAAQVNQFELDMVKVDPR